MQLILREKEQMAREIQMLKEQSKSLMEKVEALLNQQQTQAISRPLPPQQPPFDMQQLVAAVIQQMQSQQTNPPQIVTPPAIAATPQPTPGLHGPAPSEAQYARFMEWQSQQTEDTPKQRTHAANQAFEATVAQDFSEDLGTGGANNTSKEVDMSLSLDSVDSCLTYRQT
jgi:hypothetical protein